MKTKIANLKKAKSLNREQLKKITGGVQAAAEKCCEERPNGQCRLWWPANLPCP